MSFESDIAKFADKADKKLNLIAKKAIIGLCSDIIADTPVDTGRLRNNWFPSLEAASDETTEQTENEAAIRTANFVNSEFKLDKTFVFTNNMPYAYRIEFEGWSAVKAPSGMVRR
ncbi:MAG: hypothetical protein LUC34_04320, partial [Campylobacter sp.]|nr:hypothetical protein [Campylobacter sp.]